MAKAGPVAVHEWWALAEELVEYLGVLSMECPELDVPEAEAVLKDAAEAAAGAVAYAAYYPRDDFRVFLSYVNFGIDYERGEEGQPEAVSVRQWLDAFCLAVLAGRAEWHGEAFHFARVPLQEGRGGRPDVELVNGFMAYVIGDSGGEGDVGASHSASREEKLAAISAAIARVWALDDESGEHGTGGGLAEQPYSVALYALRALVLGDQEGFWAELARLLGPYSAMSGPGVGPRSLIPLLPLALAALAHRREGWEPAIDTGYLPRALVTGFESGGPRVREYGRDRRADAVAQLADAGVVVVERPENPRPLHPESQAIFERSVHEILAVGREKPVSAAELAKAMRDHELLFMFRATLHSDVTDEQLESLFLASQLGAAAVRVAGGEPASSVDVVINGTTVSCVVEGGRHFTGAGQWATATNFALITGRREDLAALVLTDPALLREDGSAFASYWQALHDYLRGEDPGPATDQAVRDCAKAEEWGFLPPPAVLFSQLVEGDEESFNLALLDALEAHRDYYRIADRADTCDTALDLDVLALACHARRRGWEIKVESPYLPARLLRAAAPF
ncbi:immunity 49 family protein [Streptomyces tailanensis]|uniref:immunity 49 family protein n=1 Tax=Streptomyces tailanensis TaxID=2569858 RepID=UPI001FE262BA|nr:immunity 49 family protein [Streptomyces tailanensis]